MAFGLLIAVLGLFNFWTAFLLQMGWLLETSSSYSFIAVTSHYVPWTAKDVPEIVVLASVMVGSGSLLLTLGVRRMLKISSRHVGSNADSADAPGPSSSERL